MNKELIKMCLARYGADESLADRLLRYGSKQYITWVVRSLVDKTNVNRSLDDLAYLLGVPSETTRYAYFTAKSLSMGDLRKEIDYSTVIVTVNEIHNNRALWDSLAKYCYRQLRCLAVERMVERGKPIKVILAEIDLSSTTAYAIRKTHIIRILKEKGRIK